MNTRIKHASFNPRSPALSIALPTTTVPPIFGAPLKIIILAVSLAAFTSPAASSKREDICKASIKGSKTHESCIYSSLEPKKGPVDPVTHNDPKKFRACVETMVKQQRMRGADASIYCMKSYNP